MKTLLFVLAALLVGCAKYPVYNDPMPKYETFDITSILLGEVRTVNVWLPEGYVSGEKSLPVLYMLDGGVNEDFPHLANTIEQLIREKKMRPVILVGIANTQRRRDYTGPTNVAKDKEIAPIVGGSAAYRQFLKLELFAEIEMRYSVRNERGIIGESLAGLFVVETFLEHPEMFDMYIAFDPSLWWNDSDLVKRAPQLLQQHDYIGKRFWFASSSAKDIKRNTKVLNKALEEFAPESLTWQYTFLPREKHWTIFRATKEAALEWGF